MVVAGLTGGIASGKTVVSDLLAERGALIIDADLLARDAVAAGTDGLAEIVHRFGSDVLTPAGDLDRPALGAVVFADRAARADLESIIHPRVRRRAAELTERALRRGGSVVVQVIPLLIETDQQDSFDCCVVVDLDPATQLARLRQRSGLTEIDARQRIDAQSSRADRLAAATWVIDNTGPLVVLAEQVDRLWRHLGGDHQRHQPGH